MTLPKLRDPITGMMYEPLTWGPLLRGFGASVPMPEDVAEERELTPDAAMEKVPVFDRVPSAIQGRVVPLFTRVRLQIAKNRGGEWKSWFRPVSAAKQPGGWLVYSYGNWRFYPLDESE